MTRDDIIRMAREARLVPKWLELCPKDEEALARFVALVAAVEREACAKVCDERKHYWQRDDIRRHEDEHCAAAIRARRST